MKIPVSAALKQPGVTGHFTGEYPWTTVEYGGRMIAFAAPLQVEGTFVYDGEGFSVRGSLRSTLKSECARCTKAFTEPFQAEFDERFEKTGSEDDGIYAYRGEELELADMIRDNVFLHLPLVSVCSEDCKGLCPVCGCDRNLMRCDCVAVPAAEEETASKNPFSALGALLNESKEV